MSTTRTDPDRLQSPGEEIANSVSHGAGLIAALIGTLFLISQAASHGDAGFIVGASVFATSMILLYLASTLYHALPQGKAKRCFRVIEHSAIFLLIAGTFTPFGLGLLRGAVGWTLLAVMWGLAAAGIALKAFARQLRPVLSVGLYVVMGWLVVVAANPLLTLMPTAGLFWLVTGGMAYSVGVVFFATDTRLRYGHLIWHLFVVAGTTCHYFAVLWYGV